MYKLKIEEMMRIMRWWRLYLSKHVFEEIWERGANCDHLWAKSKGVKHDLVEFYMGLDDTNAGLLEDYIYEVLRTRIKK